MPARKNRSTKYGMAERLPKVTLSELALVRLLQIHDRQYPGEKVYVGDQDRHLTESLQKKGYLEGAGYAFAGGRYYRFTHNLRRYVSELDRAGYVK